MQCEHCHTKYRIPDQKVKGKVARVRCTKCGNTFTILPEGDTSAAAPPGQPPPVSTAASTAPKPPEPSQPKPDSEPSGETQHPPFLSSRPTGPTTSEHPRGPASEPPDITETGSLQRSHVAAPEIGSLPESPPKTRESPPSPEDANGGGSHRPVHEIDRNMPAPPVEGEMAESRPDEFGIESTARKDYSEPLQAPGKPPGEASPDTPHSFDGEMGWGNISLDSEPDKQADGAELGLAEGIGGQPPPPPSHVFDEDRPEIPGSEAEHIPVHPSISSHPSETAAPKKTRSGFLILLILVLLGAGGYFAYPKVMERINPQTAPSVGTLILDKIEVRPLTREDGNLLYTVRGVVRNDSSGSVGMIQVEAQFRNTAGTVVAKSAVYCGNTFDDKEITSGDLGRLLADLQNELGQSLSNSGIQPGQDVPFLIVLENPPSDISKVTVTISGFKETT